MKDREVIGRHCGGLQLRLPAPPGSNSPSGRTLRQRRKGKARQTTGLTSLSCGANQQ
ncbi:hypothetical protein ACCUM_4220 [Candidatus Accumulibacter phosphatis]|uniref:Uncharacterized protein n=1 Tax=Candidatus Accumulibacter phosphatis TaxID=327160 RepID=A0A5S4EMF1_9PROT|nr:hypothetical protein ACCUM_4220 [Candidatus Accumulibacter phosphatis]